MADLPNPYNWGALNFAHPKLPHPEMEAIMQEIANGGVVTVLGGHGMGKSVLLDTIKARLKDNKDKCVVVDLDNYSSDMTYIEMLARKLKVPPNSRALLSDVLDQWADAEANPDQQLVLLFDELDRLADPGLNPSESRQFMSGLETWRQKNSPRLGLVGAGGLWLLQEGRASLGSPWMARARSIKVRCFDPEDLKLLAEAFKDKESFPAEGFPDEALQTLKVLSGGIPLLAVYGLQKLWDDPATPTSAALQSIFGDFVESYEHFLRSIRDGLTHRGKLDAPLRLFRYLAMESGPLSPDALSSQTQGTEQDPDNKLPWEDCLDLLVAAGAINRTSPRLAHPIACHAIPSILALFLRQSLSPETGDPPASLQDRLNRDLRAACRDLHLWGPDFYHGASTERRLVEEGTFCAFIGVALKGRERRSSGAGRRSFPCPRAPPVTPRRSTCRSIPAIDAPRRSTCRSIAAIDVPRRSTCRSIAAIDVPPDPLASRSRRAMASKELRAARIEPLVPLLELTVTTF